MVLKVSAGTLVLDAECLEQLGASATDEFEVTRNGNVIELRGVPFDRRAHIRALSDSVMAEHDKTFRKLSQ